MQQAGGSAEGQGRRNKKTVADAGIDDFTGRDDILFYDTLLRYYLHVDPEVLPDEKWAWTIRFLLEIRMMENKANG